ncbi:transposase [Brucella pseudogrignonensis]|uniref:transposase n=1 Tax=Brucella pseudogrignonensis TaxID=419475 RepID=UPI0038D1E963
MSRPPVQRGTERSGAWTFSRRVHNQNPCQSGQFRPSHSVRSDRRRSVVYKALRDIARHRPRHNPGVARADKGYSSKSNRAFARARGIAPVIPHKSNEKNKWAFFAKTLYKARARIEQGFGRLKRFKLSLPCDARKYCEIIAPS